MSLPPRQQATLDQIEQGLQATDPRLKSMFAAFLRSTRAQPIPATEVISSRSPWRALVVVIIVISSLGVLTVGIRATSNDCPGLSSDQAVVSPVARYAGCSKSTAVWSRGGR
jgi:Protein of unknown function (DUF3040)